ncbi:hypothetical protein Ndes2437B_g06668 [Nannochloris sp. 'desiccata']
MDPGVSRQQIEHWWQPSPVKRTLLELPKFRYLFGNTRHMPLFRNTNASLPQNRVALLGFGDPRNAWSTANAAMDAGCKQLQIDLVDIALTNVARGVLLEYLSTHSEVNASGNEEDALFLWVVMYCATMPPSWLARLQSFINELLKNGNNELFKSYFGRGSDADAVKQVLQSWAKPAPSAAVMKEKRRLHLAVWLSRKLKEGRNTLETANEIDPKWENCLEAMAAQIVIAFEVDSKMKSETDALKKMAQEECYAYLKTGTIYPKDIPSMVEVPESDWVGNPTLLEPGSGGWYVHYGAAPFLSYLPMKYSQSEKKSKGNTKSKSSKPLTESCFAEFRALASGRRRAGARTKMRFFLGDAVELCCNGVLEHGIYSTVDTSNIADNIGLLNTLVTCQPLLLPDPHAALFTTSMTWGITSSDCLQDYFDISLGVDLQLTPTLLGLRLLNPPEFGRATPRSILTTVTSDIFVWQPVVPIATGGDLPSPSITGAVLSLISAPLPRLKDSPELLNGLQSMVQICTRVNLGDSGRCGADAGTTLTVLHLLRGLSERVEGVLPSHEAEKCDWEAVASHTASICNFPKDLRKQWDALVRWCFGELGSSVFTGKKNAPMLLSWKVDPSPSFKMELEVGSHTSMLQGDLAVFTGDMGSVLRSMFSDDIDNSNTRGDLGSMMKRDRLDIVGFDCTTLQAQCLLPPNLNISEMAAKRGGVILSDIGHGMRRPLSRLPIHPLAEMKITPCSIRPPLRLAASNWVATAHRAAAASKNYSTSKQIKLIRATESVEKYHFSFKILQPEGKPAKKAPVPTVAVELPEGGKVSVWGEEVSRKAILKIKDPVVSVALAFSSAASSKDLKPRLSRKKAEGDPQRFEVNVSKSSFWPGDEILFSEESQKIKVEGLPTAALHELDLGKMFSLAEGAHKLQSGGQGPAAAARSLAPASGKFKGGVLFDAKETLQSIFVLSLQHGNGKMIFTLHDPKSKTPNEASLIVFVHGIFKLPDGRPLAHISCVDQELAYQLYPSEQQKMPALRRCQKMMQVAGGRTVKTSCAVGEVDFFRKIFKRNSVSLVVPKWQKKLMEGAPEWIFTYLTPFYSDSVVEGSIMDTVPDISSILTRLAAGQMGSQAAGAARAASSSSAGSSSSCSVCGKTDAKLCSRCKKSYFCSQECQKRAWPQHKKACKAS